MKSVFSVVIEFMHYSMRNDNQNGTNIPPQPFSRGIIVTSQSLSVYAFSLLRLLCIFDTVSASIAVGSLVWVEDPEVAWIDGEVVEVNGEEIKVICTSGKTAVANVENVYPLDPDAPPCGVDDMTKLAYLHEPGVLYNLRCRYDMNEIYVSSVQSITQMINEGISQAILVSGESGAGKTESTKMLMQYLAYMGGRVAAEGRSVEQQVLESNPVLEAFGNAKTVRNNNSSRFGKFVELQFDSRGKISGAAIRTYLLERSRVCQVSDPERNYHCFYMLCAAPAEDIEKYKLGNPRTFHYLNQSNFYELDGVDESKEYLSTRRAMDVVGISSEEQDAIFRVVAAILHLGNIEFTKVSESDASQPKDDQSRFHLKTAADLLMCNENSLEDSLCKRVMVTRDETITRSLDPAAAAHVFKMEQEEYTKEEIDWSYIEFIDNQDILDLIEKVTYQTELFLDKNKDYVVAEHQALLSASSCSFVSSLFPPLPEESSKSSKFSSIGSQFKQQLQALLETLSATEPHYIRCVKPNNLLKPAIFENANVLQQLRCGGVMEAIRISCAGFPSRKTFDEFISRFKILQPRILNGSAGRSENLFNEGKNGDFICSCNLKHRLVKNLNLIRSLLPHLGAWFGGLFLPCSQDRVSFPCIHLVKPNRSKIFPSLFPSNPSNVELIFEIDLDNSDLNNSVVENWQNKSVSESWSDGRTGFSPDPGARKICVHNPEKSSFLFGTQKLHLITHVSWQVARHIYVHRRRTAAALSIQKDIRTFLARKAYALLSSSAILIQAGLRGMAARDELQFRKKTKAAIIIQSHFRGYLACYGYLMFKAAAIATQCAWRAKKARRELRMLKLAAKETGALQEAKNKLEKEVEELTWQLQLEKRTRADIEEAKNQETAKLQSALEKMQMDFKETKEQLMNELEAAKKVAKQVPVTQEVSVIDHELVDKLTAENEKLKFLVSSLEKKIDETEKKYEETNKLSEDRLKQALEAESKIIQLKTAMQRLEEKLSDMETEDQILRQQALINTPAGKMSGRLVQTTQEPQSAKHMKRFGSVSDEKLRRSQIERQRESIDALVKCVTLDLGFSEGKPVAAFTIYKCLVHWRSFEAERTSVFDRLIQIIGSAIEDEANNDYMAYWLSNTSTLLFLLQQTIKASVSTPRKPPQPTSFFGRMAQGFRSSPSSDNLPIGGLDGVHQVEAKYPALLFKQQLTAYVEKIYGIIRDNAKKELSSLITSCIQEPRTSREDSLQSSGRSFNNSSPTSNWESIIESLNGLLNTLKNNFFAGPSWDELKHVRQAVGFLVIHQKSRITYDDLTTDLCPILSIQQLYRICTLYGDDNFNTPSVAPEVISSMKILMTEDSNDADSNSFLLDDDSSSLINYEFFSRGGTVRTGIVVLRLRGSTIMGSCDVRWWPEFRSPIEFPTSRYFLFLQNKRSRLCHLSTWMAEITTGFMRAPRSPGSLAPGAAEDWTAFGVASKNPVLLAYQAENWGHCNLYEDMNEFEEKNHKTEVRKQQLVRLNFLFVTVEDRVLSSSRAGDFTQLLDINLQMAPRFNAIQTDYIYDLEWMEKAARLFISMLLDQQMLGNFKYGETNAHAFLVAQAGVNKKLDKSFNYSTSKTVLKSWRKDTECFIGSKGNME
ncbi:hypothetical protein DH2020_043315 [Rehmannia glutinosa]|uniref:Uncharacterized protein n=1 Tax=Rehmannia glutinosa TaxID=99300 RepID=A0ABR0UK04_REHGL